MPVCQEMFYPFVDARLIIKRYLNNTITRYPFYFAQQQPFMLHMLQNVRKYDQVNAVIIKWQTVTIKQLHRQQVVNISFEDAADAAFRNLSSMIFRSEVLIRQEFEDAAVARAYLEHFFKIVALANVNDVLRLVFSAQHPPALIVLYVKFVVRGFNIAADDLLLHDVRR